MDQGVLANRILGSLAGGCIGDTFGALNEQQSIDEIRSTWGGRVESFHPPPDDAPFAQGRKPGQITAVAEIATTIDSGLHMSEAVPAALGILLAASGDPFLSAFGRANVSDDTDTVACIAGSLAGAMKGAGAVPTDLDAQVLAANNLDLEERPSALADAVVARAAS